MQNLDPNFVLSLRAARDAGIAPVWFFWVIAPRFDTGVVEEIGLWTGDEDIPVTVQRPTGGVATRPYLGGTNLAVLDLDYVADLTDEPVTVTMSQIAPATEDLVRGHDLRLAYCEIHVTSWIGGRFTSIPQLQWVGQIDDAQVGTPEAGTEGSMVLTVRSELMTQLLAINPAKSSDAHQKRRQVGDRFSEYSGVIRSRTLQWFKEDKR